MRYRFVVGVLGTCIDCGGPAHESSGAAYRTATGVALVCGPCTRKAWRWVRQHVNAPWRHAFYEAAGREGPATTVVRPARRMPVTSR